MAITPTVRINVSGGRGSQGFKGDPGGNIESIGTYNNALLGSLDLAGTNRVTVSGTATEGDDGAGRQFAYNSAIDSAYITENPGIAFLDADGRGFLEVQPFLSAQGPTTYVKVDNGYDATWDVIKARARPDYDGDQDAINAVAAVHANWCLNPAVGAVDSRSQIELPLPSPRVIFLGGKQRIAIDRNPSHTGHTIRVGSPSQGCGGASLENIFFRHAGRIGYTGSGTLPGVLLTNNQSHIMMHGAQGAQIVNCGGWGAVHGVRLMDSNIVVIRDWFNFGGVYDNDYPTAQEAVSVINLATGPNSGHNTSIRIEGGALYGSSVGNRTVNIGGMTVIAPRRAGPASGILVNSCEDWHVKGALVASMSDSAVKWAPDSISSYNVNGIVEGCNLDESNLDCVSVFRGDASYVTPDSLIMVGNTINGQLVSRNGLTIYNGPGAIDSLRRFKWSNNTVRATLGAAVRIFGARGVDMDGGDLAGYNIAYSSDIEQATGIVLGGTTKDVSLSNLRIGGGINGYDDDPTPNANGLSANGCSYGIYRGPNLQRIVARNLNQMPFGKPGGSFLARQLDGGGFTFDPSQIFDAPTYSG